MRQENIQRFMTVGLCLIVLIGLASCAPANGGAQYGFWGGLWHGLCFSFALIGKFVGWVLHLINSGWGSWNIGLWADNTTGFTYWLGYFIAIFFLGGGTMAFSR